MQQNRNKIKAILTSVLEQMLFDSLNGMSKFQIKQKFVSGGYGDSLKKDDARYRESKFYEYWNKMNERFAEEIAESRESLKASFFAKYQKLYEQAVKEKDLKNAKLILDSIVKLTGVAEPEKKEIKINDVDIDFKLEGDS